jgi:uncharacterized protein (TIGR02996 family)
VLGDPALLGAIHANPDDDAARLVYADLLESRGDPRGEFIQLQCRAEHAPTPELLARIAELERAHASTWLEPILALALGARFTFRRGFIDGIQGRFPAVVDHAAVLAAHAPLLQTAALGVGGQRDRDRLANPAGSPVLRRLRRLRFFGKRTGETREGRGPIARLEGLRALGMENLRALQIETVRAKGSEVRDLVASLPALDELALRMVMPIEDTAQLLPHLASLRVLELDGARIDSDTFLAWLARDHLRLEHLTLRCEIAVFALARLTSAHMPSLRTLSIAHPSLDEETARALGAWTTARIDLLGTRAGTDVVAALAGR